MFPRALYPWLACAIAVASCRADEGVAFFESKVRPLLVERCIECHGEKKQKGGLRLDSKKGWEAGGDSGVALVPGQPEESLLIKAVSYLDKDLQMPPKKQLAPEEAAVLKEWIRRGAPDPRVAGVAAAKAKDSEWAEAFQQRLDWWSLKPLRAEQPPVVPDAAWSREPVDRFIRAALDAAQLVPAATAEPEVLLRRMSLVLTGLPPAPEQRERFLASWKQDASAAGESLVDELLASPHFGEHFARHWMDVVRYTDTYGYEWDIPAKGSWEYRDYLIRAFNADIGFDQLLREQLAGDLLPAPRLNRELALNESLIGPMFYHLGEHRHGDSMSFNGIHQDMVNNKIDAFSKTFLATTVACARCHNHKLEAVSQRDYYALAAVFMTPRWTARVVDAPGTHDEAIAKLKELRGRIRSELATEWQAQSRVFQAASLRAWATEKRFALENAKPGEVGHALAPLLGSTVWMNATDITPSAADAATQLAVEKDGAILASGVAPEKDTYTVRFTTGAGCASLLRLEALSHDSLPTRGPGRTSQGNFALTQLRVEVKPFGPDGKAEPPRAITLASAEASYSQPGYGVENLVQPNSRRGWAVGLSPQVKDHTARFTFSEPVTLPHSGEWTITLDHQYGTQHVLGRFRLAVGGRPDTTVAVQDADIEAGWRERASAWKTTREQRQKGNAPFRALADFREPKLPAGWVTEGDGMRHGFVEDGMPLIALEGDAVIAGLLPRGFHTHALSSKLPGSVFLPPQETWSTKTVSVQFGGEPFSAMQALVGNAFLGEDFGGGSPGYRFVTNPEPEWKTFSPVVLKNGVPRLLIKLTTAPLNSYFPARTGLVKGLPDTDFGYEKRSWLSITGIVGSDQAGAPQDTLDAFTTLYDTPPPKSADEAWQRIGEGFTSALRRWCEGNPVAGDVRLLNWTLNQKLLPNRAAKGSKLASLLAEYRLIEQGLAFPRTAMSMDERECASVKYPLNVRGDVDAPGELVTPDFLQMFAGQHDVAKSAGSGRLELAESLLNPEHPLTSRVYVNRVWQWIFGAGLVETPDDFGRLGGKPSHPELLDWLAREFMREGWSTKSLVRRLVLSETFCQSGARSAAARERDPGNRLLHHYPTRRLEAEGIRDALLAVSGRLDPQLYGRPIAPFRTAEDGKKRLFSGPLDGQGRRSLYLQMSIMAPPVFLAGFNLPELKLPTGKRDVTNVPGQALLMLNDPMVSAMAKHWSAQLLQTAHASAEDRVRAMFVQAFGRTPQADEVARWTAAVRDFATPNGGELMHDEAAWAQLAHTVFNTTEFLFYR